MKVPMLSLLLVSVAAPTCMGQGAMDNSAEGVSISIQGRSGAFTISNATLGDEDPNRVSIKMDALMEVDSNGNQVGKRGQPKHSFNNFAQLDFTFSDPTVVQLNENVSASLVTFNAAVSTIGRLKVDTYILLHAGAVGPEGDSWNAIPGDLKWNIELSDWTWCGCSDGEGAFVDVDIEVKGKSDTADRDGNTFDLGDVTMELTNLITVDDVTQPMPAGFPMVTQKGSKQIFTFRFPKFNNKAVYDPLMRTGEVETDTPTPTPTTPPTPTPTGPTPVPAPSTTPTPSTTVISDNRVPETRIGALVSFLTLVGLIPALGGL